MFPLVFWNIPRYNDPYRKERNGGEFTMGFWAHLPEHINPDILKIGSFQIRYYGIMYLCAFATVYALTVYRLKHEPFSFTVDQLQSFFVWAVFGVLVGGRLGYVVFYGWAYYSTHLLEIILPFDFSGGVHFTGISGMSYHGGFIGVALGTLIFCRRNKINFWRFVDLICPAIPLGYTFGRIGNFLNGELYGRVTTVPWGMYFPMDATHRLRHPSQLYEAFFEGIFLFIILWSVRKRGRFDGFLFTLYLIGYGAVRFFIEFVRQPDPQLGFVLGPLSMGQVLCLLMVLAGISVMIKKWPDKTTVTKRKKGRTQNG